MPTSRERRAEYLFAAYIAGGDVGRPYSLEDFACDLVAAGVKISLGTLKRYSVDYSWQERASHVWALRSTQRAPEQQRVALAAEGRRNRVGQALLGVGGRALQSLLEDDARVRTMRAGDIARILDLGMRADGQSAATLQSVTDLNVQIWNDVTVSVMRIFSEVNAEPGTESRALQFAERLDELVTARLRAAREHGDSR